MTVTYRGKTQQPAISPEFQGAVDLLGGSRFVNVVIHSELDVHLFLTHGLPRSALNHLIANVSILGKEENLKKAIGLSTRTTQRHKSDPEALLSEEQGGRAWKFAEILSKATEVFGSREAAERWLEKPALALNQSRPIDLLSTQIGTKQVETLLSQLEYCVYI